MGSLLTILIIVGCIALILFVLVQNPKGGGLNSEFGSAVQLGGAKRATDILAKGTWGLAAGVAVLCLFMAKDVKDSSSDDGEIDDIESNVDAIDSGNENTFDGLGTGGDNGTTLPTAP